jgi:hypothetical protein
LAKKLAFKKKVDQQRISLQALSQASFASFVPNILSLQQTFFVGLALLQLVNFVIVDGKIVTTTIRSDCTCT